MRTQDLSSKMKNMMKELIEYGYSDYDKNKNQLNIHGSVSKVLDIFDP
jgi:stalled ribosome rescue protein Dom34